MIFCQNKALSNFFFFFTKHVFQNGPEIRKYVCAYTHKKIPFAHKVFQCSAKHKSCVVAWWITIILEIGALEGPLEPRPDFHEAGARERELDFMFRR